MSMNGKGKSSAPALNERLVLLDKSVEKSAACALLFNEKAIPAKANAAKMATEGQSTGKFHDWQTMEIAAVLIMK